MDQCTGLWREAHSAGTGPNDRTAATFYYFKNDYVYVVLLDPYANTVRK